MAGIKKINILTGAPIKKGKVPNNTPIKQIHHGKYFLLNFEFLFTQKSTIPNIAKIPQTIKNIAGNRFNY
jgi:hypothetical protein